ncbi:MAG TPA: hypothetical protein IAB31_00730 [Candidatus Choladousia intestinavium]|uniref:Uncharacterized protein n=1 Tax=Candidatus Choladousia intestinavium TaxID=2840727 RepID=A0A9D1A9H9_9FIRM|nr:hypothetical protein [Candidatus Choladousia intestinavium]
MRRLIGYTLFWIAIGILIGIFIGNLFFSIVLTFVLVLLGYNLFMC